MASSNSIRIRELEEQKRLNDANIQAQKRKIDIDEARLAEDIQDHLRTYGINLSKNQIQRIANDQLNERESMKIIETMRSNMAKELETNRHNLADEDIKRAENAIKKMDVLIQGGKVGRGSIEELIAQYLMNQSLLQAFGGTSVPQESINWLMGQLGKPRPDDLNRNIHNKDGIIKYADESGKIKDGLLAGKYFDENTGQIYSSKREYLDALKGEYAEDQGYGSPDAPKSKKGGNTNEGDIATSSVIQKSRSSDTRPGYIPKEPGDYVESTPRSDKSSVIDKRKESKGPGDYGLIG